MQKDGINKIKKKYRSKFRKKIWKNNLKKIRKIIWKNWEKNLEKKSVKRKSKWRLKLSDSFLILQDPVVHSCVLRLKKKASFDFPFEFQLLRGAPWKVAMEKFLSGLPFWPPCWPSFFQRPKAEKTSSKQQMCSTAKYSKRTRGTHIIKWSQKVTWAAAQVETL